MLSPSRSSFERILPHGNQLDNLAKRSGQANIISTRLSHFGHILAKAGIYLIDIANAGHRKDVTCGAKQNCMTVHRRRGEALWGRQV
ncbi:MAG: hypothetical protein WDM89_17015, partial [Rhizomicrobium sp.]